jgi:LPXTG-motif cell wall-anchored protein
MHNKIHRKVSWITLLFFFVTLFNNVTYKVAEAVETSTTLVKVNAVAVLVGDLVEPNGLGKNWEPLNYQTKLKEYKNGIYEQRFKLKAGTYNYKIAMNGTWDEGYGVDGGGDNITLTLTEDKDVFFRLDLVNKKVYDSVNNANQFKTKGILVGGIDNLLEGGKSWDPSDNNFQLDYVGGGIYKKTFNIKESAQDSEYNLEYKVAYNGAWDNGNVADNTKVLIPAGTSQITFTSNYLGNYVSDSISSRNLQNAISIIGTVRGNADTNWVETSTDYDMYLIDESKYMFTSNLPIGTYEYKGVVNRSWDGGGLPASGNVKVSLTEAANVVFIADTKSGTMVDSVNNPSEVATALGLSVAPEPVESTGINSDGTITFYYKDANATSVYLAGSMNGYSSNSLAMTKNAKGVWETTVRVGDEAKEVSYKFVVDGVWTLDPINTLTDKDGNSKIDFPKYTGRHVTLPGTLSLGTSEGTGVWDPADKGLQLKYMGNGTYSKTFKGFKEGRYEFKAALDYSWTENYGAKGISGGSNIPLTVPADMDITFTYNDDSHNVVTNLSYKPLDITLTYSEGNTINLTDDKLNNIYKGQATLKAGTYENIKLTVSDGTVTEIVNVDKLVLETDKMVIFSYDPITKICFNNSSDEKVDVNGIYYNSRETEYKSPYGASPVDSPITFSMKVKNTMAKSIKMVITKPNGTEIIELKENGIFDSDNEKWSGTFTPDKIGTYSYYFVVSNGADIKAYGDDDGFFGAGIAGELGDPGKYDFNVSAKGFKTPEWLKNGVIYQIYPDRFFNGDTDNDYLQKYSRGDSEYEFPADWYSLPKDPDLYGAPGYEGNYGEDYELGSINTDNYVWANDMYGGDLKGVEEKVNYLKSLGVTVLYMNPIGQSISSHRYDTTDYTAVDPLLGTMDEFVELAQVAEKNGMHLILDGVFNHVAEDSVYFDRFGKYVSEGKSLGAYQYWASVYDEMGKDTTLTQESAEAKIVESYTAKGITDFHYKDWFKINNTIVNGHYDYEGWGGYDSMPVIQALDGSEYNVETWADEIIDGEDSVTREWLQNGSDGWRLDVANEVSDETWRNFRTAVKEEGDNAVIGEIWSDASSYILGDMYDSVMNYRFRGAMLGFVQGTKVDDNDKTVYTAQDATNELEKMREQYPREALEAMMNLVDSHDTQRVTSSLDGYGKGGENRGFAEDTSDTALEQMRLVSLLQMTYIGAPTIYYGDEMGIAGCDDPDNRRGTIWGAGDQELVKWYAQMAAIRSAYSNLRTGNLAVANVEGGLINDVLAYVRSNDTDKALVAANRLATDIEVTIETPGIADGTVLTNAINTGKTETYTVKDGKVKVKIPAYRGVILVDNVKGITVNYEGLKDAYDASYKVADRVTPVDDTEVIEAIAATEVGKEVIISTINEGISRDVLEALVNADKNLIPVILRGNVKMKVKDVKALLAKLIELGQNDFQVVFNDNVKNTAALKKIKTDIVYAFSVETNLTDGILGTDLEMLIPVDAKYNGKILYLYNIDNDGKFQLVDEAEVKDGIFNCTVNHFSDYVILDEKVPAEISTDPVIDPVVATITAGTTTKTGDSSNILVILSMLFIASGTLLVIIKKKKI